VRPESLSPMPKWMSPHANGSVGKLARAGQLIANQWKRRRPMTAGRIRCLRDGTTALVNVRSRNMLDMVSPEALAEVEALRAWLSGREPRSLDPTSVAGRPRAETEEEEDPERRDTLPARSRGKGDMRERHGQVERDAGRV